MTIIDHFVLPDCPPEIARDWLSTLEAILWNHGVRLDLENAEPGNCDDCEQPTENRIRYGHVTVCRPCLHNRLTAARILETDTDWPDEWPDEPGPATLPNQPAQT